MSESLPYNRLKTLLAEMLATKRLEVISETFDRNVFGNWSISLRYSSVTLTAFCDRGQIFCDVAPVAAPQKRTDLRDALKAIGVRQTSNASEWQLDELAQAIIGFLPALEANA